jgi:hypothetical protein
MSIIETVATSDLRTTKKKKEKAEFISKKRNKYQKNFIFCTFQE